MNFYSLEPLKKTINFEIKCPDGGWRRIFNTEYLQILKPYAEVIAIIDNNSAKDWSFYVHIADAVYRTKTSMTSWEEEDQDPQIHDLQEQIKIIRKLKGISNENTR